MRDVYEVIIIGAGQAGIAMSQKLKTKGIDHLMIDSSAEIGQSWLSRYKSLVLFTPKRFSSLPGLEMEGDPESYPTREEMAAYLQAYVSHFQLPYELNIAVNKLEFEDNVFRIATNKKIIYARQVVVATGAFQKRYIPPLITSTAEETVHLHSSEYVSPADLSEGTVLVVGGGNSGAQIAVELAKEQRDVFHAISAPIRFLPLRLFGQSIFHWLEKSGLLYAGLDTKRGRWFQKKNDPVFGMELKKLIKAGRVIQKPRVRDVVGQLATFDDGTQLTVKTIIWATGFVPDYNWIQIDGILTADGQPKHERGVTGVKGLFFLGLPWQHQRGSALICGVGKDAEYVALHIEKNLQT
ncbi:NAD(P)/FAD-dependent oxidoreductase [Alkalihalobacillus oceani]|uniref:NAD(P)/FAD-dependent oxidoreductase n=1 Tax=Halalkalibacter oceani TaxID=1653776 RepID=A0A9X2DRY4_9BACI|nr:NAD(P)/FAD-dependent oxidoreductase [Halalkalibacter oceani]MCM3715944.1 NAD(P)/FAD-dependent oxidoreductase [Halalkalibacter oceani]